LCDDAPVLYVCYDSPMPAPLSEVMPVVEATAIAIVIAPRPTAATVGLWTLAVGPREADAAWPAWMPASWHANASARGFAALATLAGEPGASAELGLSPRLGVRVERC
jgi:hypothetical protein